MQMICALLIFQTPDLPYPLWRLSPWLEAAPGGHVYDQLAAQRHRRFVKTHAPLSDIPSDPQVTYIVTARDPLDAFVSMYHQNKGAGPPPPPPPGRRPGPPGRTWPPPPGAPPPPAGRTLHDALVEWVGDPESLRSAMDHLSGAWARRDEPNVLLVHYDDLQADLEGQMRWLAARLGISVPEQSWPALAEAATFDRMKDREEILVPQPPPGTGAGAAGAGAGAGATGPAGTSAFFRRGTSGAAREILGDEEMAAYYARAAQLAPAGMIDWLMGR